MILILAMYMLFASTFTIGKVVLSLSDPIFFIGVRMTIAGILLLAYHSFVEGKSLRIDRNQWGLFILIALIHIYLAYITEFWALQYVLSAKACLLYNFSPFLTALFTYALFRETLSYQKIAGLIVGFLGFLPILIASSPEELAAGHWGFISLAELVLLISVTSSVCGWLIFKKLLIQGNSPWLINGCGMTIGGLFALATSWILEGKPHIGFTNSPEEIMLFIQYTVLMIIIANVIGYNLYGYLLHHYSPTLLSFFGFTTPLFAAVYGTIFLKEPVSFAFFVSVALVSIGLYLFYQQELKELSYKKI